MKEEDLRHLGVIVPTILVVTISLFAMVLTKTIITSKEEILKEIRLIDTNKVK